MPGTFGPLLQVALAAASNLTHGCIDRFDPQVDYFPAKAPVEEAHGFTVTYHRSYKLVTVAARPGGPAERYVLLQCGAPRPTLPPELASVPVIPVPVKSFFSASATQLPSLVDLGRLDVLAGVRSFALVVSPPVRERTQAGRIVEFGSPAAVDAERVVAAHPDVLMTSGDGDAAYNALRGAGTPVVSDLEWLEPTPLGRAEWVEFIALFLNEEGKAASLYRAVRDRYQALAQRTRAIPEKERPRVMTGGGLHGQFHIAGGRSYVARLIRDAGGQYVWDDDTETGMPLVDLETQLRRAVDADIWINGGRWKDRAAILADEPRYAEFKAFRTGQVWVYERRVNAAGGNDYWSRGVTRPDLVLADLVRIFHPHLVPDHELEWYVQVPAR